MKVFIEKLQSGSSNADSVVHLNVHEATLLMDMLEHAARAEPNKKKWQKMFEQLHEALEYF